MKFFRKWGGALKWSRLAPLKKFTAMVEEHLDGILSYCDRKVPLGDVESTNQKAKNVIVQREKARQKLLSVIDSYGAVNLPSSGE